MLNFELYNPTNYIFGKGQISKLKDLLPANTKILLAYGGGSIFKNGIYNQVIENLKGFDVIEFGGIEPNPHYETLMKAVQIIKDQKIDFILAVGGGSVIDGVKFISAAVKFDGNPMDILHKRLLIKENTIPFGTVLTLPATGSEMNSGAVITIESTQEKLSFGGVALFPKFSICDPTVIQSLPKRQLENGVVDAFTHVLEQYLTYPQNAFLQDRIAEGILQTLIEIGPEVVKNPTDYALASNFMWSCTMALNGLLNKGVVTDWATHSIGHELTALYNIDHARTLAIIAPSLYEIMFDTKKEKLAQYGERVFGLSGDVDTKAKQAIIETKKFFETMGMPINLSSCNVDHLKSAQFIRERFEERGWLGLGEKQLITPELVEKIVKNAY